MFDLPQELLSTISLKDRVEQPLWDNPSQAADSSSRLHEVTVSEDNDTAKATSCGLCGVSSVSVLEQRNHFRSDLHGFNLKQKLRGLKPVGEDDFEKLIGDLDESISGSESSESEDDVEDENKARGSALSLLLKKQAKIANSGIDEFASNNARRGAGKPPLLWFTSPLLPADTFLGIYRSLFSNDEQAEQTHLVEALRNKQLNKIKLDGQAPSPSTEIGPHYFLCMIGGGHFAAMIVALAPKIVKKAGLEERSATVIAHKTFHRYTTRRKQGGSQSANDSSKGAAHSAGSSLRRYNEAALTSEVRDLLQSWKTMIDSADLIFVRATGSTNRRTLFGPYEGQVLRNSDPRNRGFPFSTRRATQKELLRAFIELTRIKQSTIDEANIVALGDSLESRTPSATALPQPSKTIINSKKDEVASLHTSQITSMVKRSKIPALLNYLKTNNIPSAFMFSPPNHHTPTPLHLAASLNAAPIVTALLTRASADPTIMNDDARTPFSLAGDRATRDAFRLARFEIGESIWDWDKAGVPPALTKTALEERETRERSEKAAKEKAESERRTMEVARLRKQSEEEEAQKREQRVGKGKGLGSALVKTGAEKREEETRGLTPEARARIERERRARAAEERIKRLQGS